MLLIPEGELEADPALDPRPLVRCTRRRASQISKSLCSWKGSKLDRIVPLKSTASEHTIPPDRKMVTDPFTFYE